MTAGELRLPNLILFEGEIIKFEEFLRDSYSSDTELDKRIQGIHITDEWLIKLGFRKENNNDWILGNILESFYCFDLDEKWLHNDYPTANCNAIAPCEYVHQLQNLYFALNGNELTIQ